MADLRRHICVVPGCRLPGTDRIGVAQVIGHAALLAPLRFLLPLCGSCLHPSIKLVRQLELRSGIGAAQLVAAHRPQPLVVIAAFHQIAFGIERLAVFIDEFGHVAAAQFLEPLFAIGTAQLIAIHPFGRQ